MRRMGNQTHLSIVHGWHCQGTIPKDHARVALSRHDSQETCLGSGEPNGGCIIRPIRGSPALGSDYSRENTAVISALYSIGLSPSETSSMGGECASSSKLGVLVPNIILSVD